MTETHAKISQQNFGSTALVWRHQLIRTLLLRRNSPAH